MTAAGGDRRTGRRLGCGLGYRLVLGLGCATDAWAGLRGSVDAWFAHGDAARGRAEPDRLIWCRRAVLDLGALLACRGRVEEAEA
ncbi:hypothetical protein [Streptomyces sp. HM190]|uniref:hypothetical protein n=1 Tax=Streptomyces sp. HM190 TaxID=2695266 RepID=UPI00135CD0C0|nr:hypothetical protein [Streptomyces sp. HM190]